MKSNFYRPHSFKDVVGQDKVVKALNNYFLDKDVPSCLLFCGNSGSGKTTLAYLTAQLLLCKHPIQNEGKIEPCHTCNACKAIEQEKFSSIMNFFPYNGKTMSADQIAELEAVHLSHDPLGNKRIILINEAQGVASLSKLLEIIETPYKDTYFIFTSTDTQKFKNMGKKDNKTQELSAFRSRVAYLQVLPILTEKIEEYLFSLVSTIDNGSIPEEFYTSGLHALASNAHGNLRQATNDIQTILKAESFTTQDIYNLLGYEDEEETYQLLLKLLNKDHTLIEDLKEKDLSSFYYGAWAIVNEASLFSLNSNYVTEPWKVKNYSRLIGHASFEEILLFFEKVNEKCTSYLNDRILLDELYRFFKPLKGINSLPRKIPCKK